MSAELNSNTVSKIIDLLTCTCFPVCVCVCVWQWKRYRHWWMAAWVGWWPVSRKEEAQGRCVCPVGLRPSEASTVTRCTAVRVSGMVVLYGEIVLNGKTACLKPLAVIKCTDTSATGSAGSPPQVRKVKYSAISPYNRFLVVPWHRESHPNFPQCSPCECS